jgi:WD40 repeat protein
LADEEKEFLKLVKKVRDVLKLQEKEKSGEKLQPSQLSKIGELDVTLKDLAALGNKLPSNTEVLDRNQDIVSMLSGRDLQTIQKKQREAQEKAQQDEARRQRREEKDREERQRAEFMTRHDRPILGIAVSQDGYIYTCSKDKFVICWSMETMLLTSICTYAGHRGAVWAIDASDSHSLISGDSDGKIILWDKDAGKNSPCCVAKPLSTFDDGGNVRVLRWCPFDAPASGESGKAGGKGGKGYSSDAKPQRFASACEKLASKPAAIAVWSLRGRTAECLFRLEDLPGKANDLRWAGGAKTKLLSCHDNGYIGVWLAEGSGSLLKTLKLHSAAITSLCLQPDSKAVITASDDKSCKVVDISTSSMETLQTYKADRPLRAVAVTSDFTVGTGNLIAAGGRDPMIVTKSVLMEDEFEAKILNSRSGDVEAAARGHFGPVHDVVFMPWLVRGRGGFATCSEDGCLRVHALDGSTLHSDKIESVI